MESLPTIGKVRFYRAVDPSSGRKVDLQAVVKDPRDNDTTALIARFKRQAELSSKLKHPGIVEVYDYGEDSSVAFVASEFVEGCTLQPRLRVPIIDAGSLIVQLLKGLAHAHSQGVLHLNVKPSNLVLTSKGQLKVSNFGGPPAGEPDSAYRSPEQVSGAEVDLRSDVFSAGVFFYELLTGTQAFPGPIEALAGQIRDSALVPASQAKPRVPALFDKVCGRSLAKSREGRPQTVLEFCSEISAAYVESFGEAPRDLVSNETAVSAFLSSMRVGSRKSRTKQSVPKTQPVAPAKPAHPSTFGAETLRTVEKELAPFLGPLARIVVKEAASKATDLPMLYELASESLGNDDDRKAFLAKRLGARKIEPAGRSIKDSDEIETATFSGLAADDMPPVISSAKSGPLHNQEILPIAQRPVPPKSAPATGASASKERPFVSSDSAAALNGKQSDTPNASIPPKAGSETSVVERLENLIGKQPESLAGYLTEDAPAVDRVIFAFSASVEALIRLYDAKGKTDGLVPQSILFDRLGKASIRVGSATSIRGTIVGAVGSPRYAAPEILAEKSSTADMSPRTADVYALGFMFYEILLGRARFAAAFPNKNDLDWLRWHADSTKTAPTLKSQLPDIPTALSDLLESMMEKDLGKRVSEPGSVLAKLKAVAQQASRTVVTPLPIAPRSEAPAEISPDSIQGEQHRNRAGLIIMIAILLLVALGVWGWRKGIIPKKLLPSRNEPPRTITMKAIGACV